MAQADVETALQSIADKLQSDVPIHVPDRRHVRIWRPVRTGLFSISGLGLVEEPRSEPELTNGLHPDKERFLEDVRDFLDYYQRDDIAQLRNHQLMGDPSSTSLRTQINEVLSGGRHMMDSELPLRTSTEYGDLGKTLFLDSTDSVLLGKVIKMQFSTL